jgi:hypothetical protein
MLLQPKQSVSPRWQAASRAPHEGLAKTKPSSILPQFLPPTERSTQSIQSNIKYYQRNVHVPQLKLPKVTDALPGPATDPIRGRTMHFGCSQPRSAREQGESLCALATAKEVAPQSPPQIDAEITEDDMRPKKQQKDTPLFWVRSYLSVSRCSNTFIMCVVGYRYRQNSAKQQRKREP